MILLIPLAAACAKPEVDYIELLHPPTVEIKNHQLIVTTGPGKTDSACYVTPHTEIKDNNIYIFGTRSLHKNIRKTRNLPGNTTDWKVFWVNRDGSTVEIHIGSPEIQKTTR
jgi:hypothetical protein